MSKTYFLAVDKIGESFRGHGVGDEGGFALDQNQVDIIWCSFGVKGDALQLFDKRDREDRPGFIRYETPPKTGDSACYLKLLQSGRNYNVWSAEEGQEYILFSAGGEYLRTRDLEGKVDLSYYAGKEGACIVPVLPFLSEKLIVRTRFIPTDGFHIGGSGIQINWVKSYEDKRKEYELSLTEALNVFSNASVLSDEDYWTNKSELILGSADLQNSLRRERKEKLGFLSPRTVLKFAPTYIMDSLETTEGDHTLCAIVRGPFKFLQKPNN